MGFFDNLEKEVKIKSKLNTLLKECTKDNIDEKQKEFNDYADSLGLSEDKEDAKIYFERKRIELNVEG